VNSFEIRAHGLAAAHFAAVQLDPGQCGGKTHVKDLHLYLRCFTKSDDAAAGAEGAGALETELEPPLAPAAATVGERALTLTSLKIIASCEFVLPDAG